jgi:hypothetical protein
MKFFDLPRFWSEVKEFNVYFGLAETDPSHRCDQFCQVYGLSLCYNTFIGAASISLIKCFMTDMCPDHLRIQIPSPLGLYELFEALLPSGVQWPFSSMQARNVTLMNVTFADQGCPQGSEALAIGFSGYYDDREHSQQQRFQQWLDERATILTDWADRRSGLKKLIIVGFDRSLVGVMRRRLSQEYCDRKLFMAIIECWNRLYGGTKGDLLYRIIPWSEWTDELYPEKTGVFLSARALRKEV